MREDAARFVDFYVVYSDNVVGWSGQKMPGLNFCPSPPLVVSVVVNPGVFSEASGHLQECLWQPEPDILNQNMMFFHPNQVFVVPKPNQSVSMLPKCNILIVK